MKILVPIKRVPDYEVKVKPNSSKTDIEKEGVKWIVNPFDEIALEEAVRLKESGTVTEITAVTIGVEEAKTQLQYALAIGADKGMLIKHDGPVDSDLAARTLTKIIKNAEFDAVFIGKQAIDSDSNQVGQHIAAVMDWPQACFASKIIYENNKFTVTREVDGGLETVAISTPCVVTADLRLNEPRYPSLPNLMKAKKKEIVIEEIARYVDDTSLKVEIISIEPPAQRQAGRIVSDVTELVEALREEKVI